MYDMIFFVWFLYIHATIIIMASYGIYLLLCLTLPLCPTACTKLPGTTRKRKRSRKQQQATTVANTRTASSVSSAMPPAASLSPAAKVKRVHTAYTLFLHGTLRIVFESGSRPVSDVFLGVAIYSTSYVSFEISSTLVYRFLHSSSFAISLAPYSPISILRNNKRKL